MKAATEVIKQFTPKPESDYSESWVIEAMKEYAREACADQREICADLVREEFGKELTAPEPELK